MRSRAIFAASLLTMMVAACGGSAEEGPVEEITVREPGESVANSDAAAAGNAATDLVAKGKAAFAVCSACHVAAAGEASRAGPNLHGVVGRQAGSLEDFGYSDALASSEIVWDAETLDGFLANPSRYVPGTNMVAGGVNNEERRAAVVAYLESLSE